MISLVSSAEAKELWSFVFFTPALNPTYQEKLQTCHQCNSIDINMIQYSILF